MPSVVVALGMDVDFRSRSLERCFQDVDAAVRAWGPQVARRYILRIGQLRAAEGIRDIAELVGARLHPLHGERDGRYAITLVGRWRLIVRFVGVRVLVEEVSNHYDD